MARPSAVANGFGGLEQIRISQVELTATASATAVRSSPTCRATRQRPLPPTCPRRTPPRPSRIGKSSLVVYDNLGNEVVLDVYFTKTGANTWEVAVYNQADAAPTTSFPYSSGPLSTQSLSFDPATGKLTGASANNIVIPVPGGGSFDMDLTQTTQLALKFTVLSAKADGNAPSAVAGVEISSDGTVYAQYENGSFLALYRIPVATVQSPDQLKTLPGNVFAESADSGGIEIGFANEGGRGEMIAGALENSNVDIAEELTNMIESQRSYTANSKVFQTGADLMDVLVNLKR